MDFNLDAFFTLVEQALQVYLGPNPPQFIIYTISGIILILAGLIVLGVAAYCIKLILELLIFVVEKSQPLIYRIRNEEARRRIDLRARFADHIESEIRRLNNNEAWSDYRFTELQAEVLAEGEYRRFSLIPFITRTRSGWRRVNSLTEALRTSTDRLILLEGEPGSGKSVALRYLGRTLAQRALNSKKPNTHIPLYINLKDLRRRKNQKIDTALIRAFVLQTLNRVNSRDIEGFLETEFDRGLKEGTWLFLFDSFDEIPEVLSATEEDTVIRDYSTAISDFLHSMNKCRGILASRRFRGPTQSSWPYFRILPLSETKRAELISNTDLPRQQRELLVGQIGAATDTIKDMASNPMFLGLLCDYIRAGNPFPQNAHSVYETYLTQRLQRDEQRLKERFHLTPTDLRNAAEALAFCMGADSGLGLNPTRADLYSSLIARNFKKNIATPNHLNALEYLKLARSESDSNEDLDRTFTFSHRRFQEYFSTCVVIREPQRITPYQLLTDGRWRETAVVLCQIQTLESLTPLLDEAQTLLSTYSRQIPNLIVDPLDFIAQTMQNEERKRESLALQRNWFYWITLLNPLSWGKPKKSPEIIRNVWFDWPIGLLHLLGILQEGFARRSSDLISNIRLSISQILLTIYQHGMIVDRKYVIQVAGVIFSPVLIYFLESSFSDRYGYLHEAAFSQSALLRPLPQLVDKGVRGVLVDKANSGELYRNYHTLVAQVSIINPSQTYLAALKFLYWVPVISALLLVGLVIAYSPFLPLTFLFSILFISLTLLLYSLVFLRRGIKFLIFAHILTYISIVSLGIVSIAPFVEPGIFESFEIVSSIPTIVITVSHLVAMRKANFFWSYCLRLLVVPLYVVGAILKEQGAAEVILVMALVIAFGTGIVAATTLWFDRNVVAAIFGFLIVIGFVMIGAGMFLGIVIYITTIVIDRYLLWSMTQQPRVIENIEDFLKRLGQYKSTSGRKYYVQFVRRANCLAPMDDNLKALSNLITLLDNANKDIESPYAGIESPNIIDWHKHYTHRNRLRMNAWGSEFMTELCHLYESIAARVNSASTQP